MFSYLLQSKNYAKHNRLWYSHGINGSEQKLKRHKNNLNERNNNNDDEKNESEKAHKTLNIFT